MANYVPPKIFWMGAMALASHLTKKLPGCIATQAFLLCGMDLASLGMDGSQEGGVGLPGHVVKFVGGEQ